MHAADAFERQDLLVESFHDLRHIIDCCDEMDDGSEAIVPEGHDCGINGATHAVENTIESTEVDGLAADLDDLSTPALNAQRATIDFTNVVGDEPALDFRIKETFLRRIPAEKRSASERPPAGVLAPRFQMWKQDLAHRYRRAALTHAVARKNRPAKRLGAAAKVAIEHASSNEDRAHSPRRRQPLGSEIVYLRGNERSKCRIRCRERLRTPRHRQQARTGQVG